MLQTLRFAGGSSVRWDANHNPKKRPFDNFANANQSRRDANRPAKDDQTAQGKMPAIPVSSVSNGALGSAPSADDDANAKSAPADPKAPHIPQRISSLPRVSWHCRRVRSATTIIRTAKPDLRLLGTLFTNNNDGSLILNSDNVIVIQHLEIFESKPPTAT